VGSYKGKSNFIGSSLAFAAPIRVEEEFETEPQNNSAAGSSLAFGATTIPEQVRVEEEIEAEPQHNSAAHIQNTTDAEPMQYAPQLDLSNQHQRESTADHSEAIPVETQDINNDESTYANTKYFHSLLSARHRRNAFCYVLVDGVKIEGVHPVRQAVFDHFAEHFKVHDVERHIISNFQF